MSTAQRAAVETTLDSQEPGQLSQEISQEAGKLFNRDFTLLIQSQFVSQVCAQGTSIAIMFWIKHVMDSASLIGLITMVSILPIVVLGPIAGTVADRYSRRSIIVVCDVLAAVAVLSLSILVFVAPESVELVLPWFFFVSILVSVIASFFKPAIYASIPDLVPKGKVAAANSLFQGSTYLSTYGGQAMGGVLFGLLGAPMLFLLDGLSYLYGALTKSFIHIPQNIPEKGQDWRDSFSKFKRDTLEGIRYVWGDRGIRSLIIAFGSLHFFLVPITILLPYYVENYLKAETGWYGFLIAAFGAGSMVGTILAGVIKISGKVRSNSIVMLLLLFSILCGTLGVVKVQMVALTVVFFAGAATGFTNIKIGAILQEVTPSEIRGRVFGVMGTLLNTLMAFGMGFAGVVADLTGKNIPLIYITCGLIMSLVTVGMMMSRDFHAIVASEGQAQ